MSRPLVCMAACAIAACTADSPNGSQALAPPAYQQAMPSDPSINPNDTYVVFDGSLTSETYVQLTDPLVNPSTGQPLTSLQLGSGPATGFHVEAGYDNAGTLRTTITGAWSPNDSLTAPDPGGLQDRTERRSGSGTRL